MAGGVEGLLGRKVGMTQVFREDGAVVPVTVLRAGPCVVVRTRTRERDGYEAAQLGLVEGKKAVRLSRPRRGAFEKHRLAPLRTLREFRIQGEAMSVGDRVLVDLFEGTTHVDVTGIGKGKGFAGVVKRHHFRGGPATHGSMFHRAPGSIGASAYPSRTIKGMRMGGHMGAARVTVKNLEVVRIDPENHLMMVKGAVPGARGTLLMIKRSRGARGA